MSDIVERFAEWSDMARHEMSRCNQDPAILTTTEERLGIIASLDTEIAEYIGVTDVTISGEDINCVDQDGKTRYQGPGMACGTFLGAETYIDEETGETVVGYFVDVSKVTPKDPKNKVFTTGVRHTIGSVAANELWVNNSVFDGGLGIDGSQHVDGNCTEAERLEALVVRLDLALDGDPLDIDEIVEIFTIPHNLTSQFEIEYFTRRLNALYRPEELLIKGKGHVKYLKERGAEEFIPIVDKQGRQAFYFEGNTFFKVIGASEDPDFRSLCLAHIECDEMGLPQRCVAMEMSTLTDFESFRFHDMIDE